MPELVSKGPDIPVGLLNQLDDDRVVFFCGAGVSMGAVSRLPNFPGLLCQVYQDNHLEPDDIEREALKQCEYDKVFVTRQNVRDCQQLPLLPLLGARSATSDASATTGEPTTCRAWR